jgi:hypothetical protein
MSTPDCKHHFVAVFDQTGDRTVVRDCSNCGADFGMASVDLTCMFLENLSDEDRKKSAFIPHYHVWDFGADNLGTVGKCVFRLNSTTASDGTKKGWKYIAPDTYVGTEECTCHATYVRDQIK